MSEDPFSERMKRLEDRLAAARAVRQPPSRPGAAAKYTQSSIAWRMVTELVAGMLLGLGIGWGLDSLFGTRPVFLVLFALLGFGAGVRTMLRTATDVQKGRSEAALMRDPAAEDKTPPEGRNATDEGRGTDG
ncbi:AtpZ/AtpI family protein [Amaricoccus sp.]|uniref:AtpZ/AtpI family protein n=1 Tax=Amaricoccus sp. TaxID=1872485 RepID=UPI001B783A4D|nr:AtpZ/AtpI family protein [Amaricoccus sp.]MBP7240580.1 AtpZ/AtpI family protein [Amaricoccus sp.]